MPEVPELSEVPELLLPEDVPPPDCELPLLLPPLLSPLRWHAASEPITSIGTHNSASHRFIVAFICMILSTEN